MGTYQKLVTLMLILMIGSSCIRKKPVPDWEADVYNSLIDTFYSVYYCTMSMPRSYTENWFSYSKYEAKGDSSKAAFFYAKLKQAEKDFRKRLDSVDVVLFVNPYLKELDITKESSSIKSYLEQIHDTLFHGLSSFSTFKSSKRPFRIDSLNQKGVKFRQLPPDSIQRQYGFVKHEYLLGYMTLSRIIIDDTRTLGILHYEYQGGPRCGYGRNVLICKLRDKWLIYRIMEGWVT